MRHAHASEQTILCVGHCAIYTISLVAKIPPPNTDQELSYTTIQSAGSGATTSITLATFGARTRFIGAVGDDTNGQRLLDNLNAFGIDTSRLVVTPNALTAFAFVLVEQGSLKRNTFWTAGTTPTLNKDIIDASLLDDVDLLVLDSYQPEFQLALAIDARKRGIHVMVGADTRHVGAGTAALIAHADTLIAAERFVIEHTRIGDTEQAIASLANNGPKTIVVTMGAEGCVGFDGEHLIKVPGVRVDMVDNLEAGDVFKGAFAYAMTQRASLKGCMRFANAAAAKSITALGPYKSLPGLGELLPYLE